jgi:hypothetical protein
MPGSCRGFGGRGRRRTSNACAERPLYGDCEVQGSGRRVGDRSEVGLQSLLAKRMSNGWDSVLIPSIRSGLQKNFQFQKVSA